MTTENIEIINDQNEGFQEKSRIESELEEITPIAIKTDIKEDDEKTEEEEGKTEELEKDKPSLNIIDEFLIE